MLYHITSPDATKSILETGLKPSDNSDSVDPLLVAEQTRDQLLDRFAKQEYGIKYPRRCESVFFYSDPIFTAKEADDSESDVIAVDETLLGNTTMFCADRKLVEDLFHDIKLGIIKGTLTDPMYDKTEIENRARKIIQEDFCEWDGEENANREVWIDQKIDSSKLGLWS